MPNEANSASAAQPANTGANEATSRPRSSLAVNASMSTVSPAPTAAKPLETDDTDSTNKGAQSTTDEGEDADIPVKFRGKSAADIAKEYKKLESDRGRMANELGQLRLTVSELLELGIKGGDMKPAKGAKAKQPDPEEDPVTNDRLLADPEKEIRKAAKKAVKEDIDDTQKRLTALEYEREVNAFKQRHPTYEETMQTDEFIEWVKRTPSRQKLAGKAVHGDFESAHELFSLWEEINGEKETKSKATKEAPAKADKVDDAATARPGSKNAASAKATAATANKPTFKRSELRTMFMKNRNEYTRRFEEIQEAYKDGRVV